MGGSTISTPSSVDHPPDRVRLLLVSPLPPPPGGIQTWTQILLERGLPSPFEFEVVDTRVTRRHQDIPPRLNRLELTRFLNILRAIWRALSSRRIALMHLNCALTRTATTRNVVSTWVARCTGVPYVIHLRGTFDPPVDGGLLACLYRKAYRMMFARAAWILALGAPSHRGVQRLGEFGSKTTPLMPNFIDRRDVPKPVGSAERRPPTALFSGALTAAKGIHTIVAAAKRLTDMHFVMVGDGPPDSRVALLDLIRSLGIEGRVRVLGPVTRSEVLTMLAASDVFVFPSTTEGFPNSVAEAMAVGLPVVASPVGAIPEMIDVPDGGFLVPWDDVPGYVEALGCLRDSAALRERMGRYNRSKALREYDYDVVVERLCSVYRHVLERRSA